MLKFPNRVLNTILKKPNVADVKNGEKDILAWWSDIEWTRYGG